MTFKAKTKRPHGTRGKRSKQAGHRATRAHTREA
jgi:hypothetical protein